MDEQTRDSVVTDIETLEELYGQPGKGAIAKELDFIHPHYRAFIEVSPFAILATSGSSALDASPRGDRPGFVTVENEKTLLLPDRRGNNRVDSLRNIINDPRVALLFLIPGVGETLRVNGTAQISTSQKLLTRFAIDGREPRTVLIITVASVFFQCSRALIRSALWDPDRHIDRALLPSTGTILADLSQAAIDGEDYDRALPERVQGTLY